MNIRSRLIIFFAFILLLSLGTAAAEFTFETLEDGTLCITGAVSDEAILTIPSSVDEIAVTRIGEGAFKGNLSLKEVTVSEGVKEIGAEAFKNCLYLESVTLPEGALVSETAFDNTPYIMNALLRGYETDVPADTADPAALKVSRGGHTAAVIIGIVIVLMAALAYLVVLPCARASVGEDGAVNRDSFLNNLKLKFKSKRDTSAVAGRAGLKTENENEPNAQTDSDAQADKEA